MSKKKKFGISEALTRGLSETINVVENNVSLYRNVVLPLSRLELDPDNPRKLAIDVKDILHGINSDDEQFQQKQYELEKLNDLAQTIKTNGIINPIVAYKHGELYRIVAGERRYLSSLLIGKQDIEARVFNDRPKSFELKLIQWVENTAREDLTLGERLGNVRELIDEYQKRYPNVEITATVLKNIVSLSLSQTSYYLSVLQAPSDVRQHIDQGAIRNLDKAALLASIPDINLRQQAIKACIDGASLKELKQLLNGNLGSDKKHLLIKKNKRGRLPKTVNMGTTRHLDVIRTIVNSVLAQADFHAYQAQFEKINWQNCSEVNQAFRKLVGMLEAFVMIREKELR